MLSSASLSSATTVSTAVWFSTTNFSASLVKAGAAFAAAAPMTPESSLSREWLLDSSSVKETVTLTFLPWSAAFNW